MLPLCCEGVICIYYDCMRVFNLSRADPNQPFVLSKELIFVRILLDHCCHGVESGELYLSVKGMQDGGYLA